MTQYCGLLVFSERIQDEPVPVPLTGVTVNASIVDLVAQVTIEQRYVNRGDLPIEAVYKFPLDLGAAVCKFSAEVDGRLIEGVIKETKQAEEEYRQGIQSGRTAFLVQEKLPDVFKAKVGNLAPGSAATIRLTYITELKVEGKEIRFFLPTTIAPRYISGQSDCSVAADLQSVTYTEQTPYRVEFKADVKAACRIEKIQSPTHAIIVTRDEVADKHIVCLEQVLTKMDRDLVLYVQLENPNNPRVICEKSPSGSAALMLSLVPSYQLVDQKSELIFVVDQSGSMSGGGISQAKKALKVFIHSLPTDCYVNIVGFGSTYKPLFRSSKKYDDTVLSAAVSYVNNLSANMGGTEMYKPFDWIFKLPTVKGYLRQIFILTDGEIDNTDQVISLVRQNSHQARVFALGLGSSASHHLVEGMARAGNGTALFASLNEQLEPKIVQQLNDALQPAL